MQAAVTLSSYDSGLIRSRGYRLMPAVPTPKADLMFRAFSDPVRLRMLAVLVDGELCVCNLMKILKLPQATTSRHLAYLRRAGLVDVRQERSWNFYALSPSRSTFHAKLLDCVSSCFSDVPGVSADRVQARTIRKQGCCAS
jgi:ArsR family transcriptional regulator